MAFKKVCSVEDIWEGEMDSFEVDGKEVLLICKDGGEFSAFQGVCPHQDIPLVEGKFDGKIITCRAHLWTFDVCSGKGINPSDCALGDCGEAWHCSARCREGGAPTAFLSGWPEGLPREPGRLCALNTGLRRAHQGTDAGGGGLA